MAAEAVVIMEGRGMRKSEMVEVREEAAVITVECVKRRSKRVVMLKGEKERWEIGDNCQSQEKRRGQVKCRVTGG